MSLRVCQSLSKWLQLSLLLLLPMTHAVANEQALFKLDINQLPAPAAGQSTIVFNTNSKNIERLELYATEGVLKMDASGHIPLSDKVHQAINSELMIYFTTEIKVEFLTSTFGIDYYSTLNELSYYTQLYAYGVNRQYVLYNNRNNKLRAFKSLDDALHTLGTLQGLSLLQLSDLPPSRKYRVSLRVKIDPLRLPAPMLLEIMTNEEWRANSGWITQTFEPINPMIQTPMALNHHE